MSYQNYQQGRLNYHSYQKKKASIKDWSPSQTLLKRINFNKIQLIFNSEKSPQKQDFSEFGSSENTSISYENK